MLECFRGPENVITLFLPASPNCHGLRLVLRLLPPSCNYSRQQASTQCCWASMAPPKPSNGTGLGKGVRSGAPGFSPSRWSCTYYRRRRLQDRINKDEMRRSKLTGQGGQSRFETLLNVLDLVYRHASVECLGSAGTAASRGGNADPAHKNNGTGLQTQTLNYQLPNLWPSHSACRHVFFLHLWPEKPLPADGSVDLQDSAYIELVCMETWIGGVELPDFITGLPYKVCHRPLTSR